MKKRVGRPKKILTEEEIIETQRKKYEIKKKCNREYMQRHKAERVLVQENTRKIGLKKKYLYDQLILHL